MENQETEYKESWRDESLKTICAFANTNGGKLFVGINDNGDVIGISTTKRSLDDLPNKIRSKLGITPSVNTFTKEGKEIIEIIVSTSNVPISYDGKYYIRSGSSTFELSNNELSQFLLKKSGLTWDGIPYPNVNETNIKPQTLDYFKSLAQNRLPEINKDTSLSNTLGNLRLLEGADIKNAGLLLFTTNPQLYFPSSTIRIGEFADETTLVTDDIVEGNLFEQVDKTLELLRLKYLKPEYYYEGVLRKERFQYPEKAIRESLLNAIVHRDYSISSNIFIKVYPNKLIISNPGELPPQLTVDSLKIEHTSIPKNPLIARVFYFAGLIESWGRGTLTMLNESRLAKAPAPVFENQRGIFSVSFFTPKGIAEKYNFNERQRFILEWFINDNILTVDEISGLLSFEGIKTSERSIRRDLSDLINWGFIERIGDTNKAKYVYLYS